MHIEIIQRFAKRLRAKLEHYLKGFVYQDLLVQVHSLSDVRIRVTFDGPPTEGMSVGTRVQSWLTSEGFRIGGLAKDELSATLTFSVSCSEQVVKDMLLLERNR